MRRALAHALTVLAAVVLLTQPARSEPRVYHLDPAHLTVAFLVQHIGFAKTLGVFRDVKGTATFDEAASTLQSIEVEIAAASVDTAHERRDNHVRGSDFLDSKKHPTMAFSLTDAKATGEKTGIIIGDLTLRGETHPVTLDVVWNRSGPYPFGDKHYTVGVSARGTIKRSEWGMTYALDGDLVGDDVEILIEAELIRQE